MILIHLFVKWLSNFVNGEMNEQVGIVHAEISTYIDVALIIIK